MTTDEILCLKSHNVTKPNIQIHMEYTYIFTQWNYWTIIWWGFYDIQKNQVWGRSYQPKPKANADNPWRDLDYSGYHNNRI